MPKWIGTINVGFGPMHATIEADNEKAARDRLYDWWLQECEDHCDRDMTPWTQELEDALEPDEEI